MSGFLSYGLITVAHLPQKTLLRVPLSLHEKKTDRLAEAFSDCWIRVLHETNQSTEGCAGVTVATDKIHVKAEMRQSI